MYWYMNVLRNIYIQLNIFTNIHHFLIVQKFKSHSDKLKNMYLFTYFMCGM